MLINIKGHINLLQGGAKLKYSFFNEPDNQQKSVPVGDPVPNSEMGPNICLKLTKNHPKCKFMVTYSKRNLELAPDL